MNSRPGVSFWNFRFCIRTASDMKAAQGMCDWWRGQMRPLNLIRSRNIKVTLSDFVYMKIEISMIDTRKDLAGCELVPKSSMSEKEGTEICWVWAVRKGLYRWPKPQRNMVCVLWLEKIIRKKRFMHKDRWEKKMEWWNQDLLSAKLNWYERVWTWIYKWYYIWTYFSTS